MVSRRQSRHGVTIIAQPNCSATWQTNKRVLLFLCAISLLIAVAFSLAGAWPILPLAGIEMSCLALALYYVSRRQHRRQVITLCAQSVRIAKGHNKPQREWILPRAQAGVAVTDGAHPAEALALSVYDSEGSVPVGEFLNREDSLLLLELLRAELRVGSWAPEGERAF